MGAKRGNILTKEIRQCPSCGGICKKSGCERANVEPVVNQFNRGIEAAQQRLMQMHRIATERHNLYHHAALELAKLKEQK